MTMTAASDRIAWSWSLVRRVAVASVVCLAAGGAVGYAVSHERGPSSSSSSSPGPVPRSQAGPAEQALVDPLRVGSSLEDYSVESIEAVHAGTMGVVVTRSGETVRLEIALADPVSPPPPGPAGRCAVYVDVHGPPPADGERLAQALARIVSSHPSVPPPPGLAPFAPHAAP
jgi:hypothetical protein